MNVLVTKAKRIYFPGLNGVRAIAALTVLIAHIELDKGHFHLQHVRYLDSDNLGRLGVSIFFALSGFLITYLLLEERLEFGKISFARFYMRRLLRILPLYLIVVLAGFLVYPRGGSVSALLLSIFFLPNLAFTLKLLPALFDPIWSVGTEIQFYLLQPQFFRIKKVSHILMAVVSFLILFDGGFYLVKHFQYSHALLVKLKDLLYYARFDNLSIAAAVAILYYFYKHQLLQSKWNRLFAKLFTKTAQIIFLMLMVIFSSLYLSGYLPGAEIFITLIASILIINLCEAETSIYCLKSNVLNFTGEISYSIYLLHKYPIHLVIWAVMNYWPAASFLNQNLAIYFFSILLTIGLSAASYYGIERYFLRLKARFAKVPDKKPL